LLATPSGKPVAAFRVNSPKPASPMSGHCAFAASVYNLFLVPKGHVRFPRQILPEPRTMSHAVKHETSKFEDGILSITLLEVLPLNLEGLFPVLLFPAAGAARCIPACGSSLFQILWVGFALDSRPFVVLILLSTSLDRVEGECLGHVSCRECLISTCYGRDERPETTWPPEKLKRHATPSTAASQRRDRLYQGALREKPHFFNGVKR
jgi:hypothetical protein